MLQLLLVAVMVTTAEVVALTGVPEEAGFTAAVVAGIISSLDDVVEANAGAEAAVVSAVSPLVAVAAVGAEATGLADNAVAVELEGESELAVVSAGGVDVALDTETAEYGVKRTETQDTSSCSSEK